MIAGSLAPQAARTRSIPTRATCPEKVVALRSVLVAQPLRIGATAEGTTGPQGLPALLSRCKIAP